MELDQFNTTQMVWLRTIWSCAHHNKAFFETIWTFQKTLDALKNSSIFTLLFSLPSADERFDATFHTNVLVNASGYCQYIPPGILKSTCYIDVRWFPFDVQKCDLKFGSWTHNGWLLDLQMLDVDTSTYIPNGEWDLVGRARFSCSDMQTNVGSV